MVPTQHLYQILKTFMDITSGGIQRSVRCNWWQIWIKTRK